MQEQFHKSKILYTGQSAGKRRKKYFSRKPLFAIFGVIAFFAFVAGAVYLLRLPRLRIQEIDISGVKSVPEEEIRALAETQLSGSILYFVPRNNYFFVSSARLTQTLENNFLRIRQADVEKTLKPSLEISVEERDIWGIGCVKTEITEVVSATSSPKKAGATQKTGPCFYIDKTGFAFEDVSSFEGGLLPIIYKDGPGELGSEIVSDSDVNFFETAAKSLQTSLQLALLSEEFSSGDSKDVRLVLKEGWTLIVPRDKSPESWISVLKTVLDAEIKDKRADLDYVDLRFGNKVFYKYK